MKEKPFDILYKLETIWFIYNHTKDEKIKALCQEILSDARKTIFSIGEGLYDNQVQKN